MHEAGPSTTQITGSKFFITITAMVAGFLAFLNVSVVNVALSNIRASFGTPLDEISWVSTAYMIANIIIIPLTGWLQKRFGFRSYFSVSIAIFTLGSVFCGLAWDLNSLIIARVIQGVGGGAIIPTSQAILFARYPKEQYGQAGAMFGIGAIIGPLLGPTIGGYLIDSYSWHWIFFMNVPIGIILVFMVLRFINEPGYKPSQEKVDIFGIALLCVGLGTLQYCLEEGNRKEWDSPLIIVMIAISIVSLIGFIVHSLETKKPAVNLTVFADRNYSSASLINFAVGVCLFSGSFAFSLFCGSVMNYGAMDIGMLFLYTSWINIIMMPLIGQLIGKINSKIFITIGLVILTFSIYQCAQFTADIDRFHLGVPNFVRSLGMGFLFVPLNVLALAHIKDELRGTAAGLYNLTRELGGSIGTAWCGFVLDHRNERYYSYLGENVSRLNPNFDESLLSGPVLESSPEVYLTMLELQGRLQIQSLVRSFSDCNTMLFFAFLCSFALVFMMRDNNKKEGKV